MSYHTTAVKKITTPPVRDRERDWQALSIDEQMGVLAFLRWDIGSESIRVQSFIRRHYAHV